MDIGKAHLNQKVVGSAFDGIGIIVNFRLSNSGLNRCYVDIQLENGNIISTPLDMVIPLNRKS